MGLLRGANVEFCHMMMMSAQLLKDCCVAVVFESIRHKVELANRAKVLSHPERRPTSH